MIVLIILNVDARKCRNWQTSKTKDLVHNTCVWVQVPSSARTGEPKGSPVFLFSRFFSKDFQAFIFPRFFAKDSPAFSRESLRKALRFFFYPKNVVRSWRYVV